MQKTIWITGASSGIGREFARRYAAMGCRLILTARRADRLQALAEELHAAHGTECRIETADLSRAEECSRLCEALADEHIDIFINNAGFGVCGSILETEEAREEEMVQVNVAAMARLFRAVVRKMHAQGGGTILNVASSAGLLPGGPYMAGYYASKAYVVSMTRGVAEELREMHSPVYVCALCPGTQPMARNAASRLPTSPAPRSAAACAKHWRMSTSTSSSTTPVLVSAAAFWKRRKPARKRWSK